MRTLHTFTRQVDRWCRRAINQLPELRRADVSLPVCSPHPQKLSVTPVNRSPSTQETGTDPLSPDASPQPSRTETLPQDAREATCLPCRRRPQTPTMFLIAVVSLTSAIGYRFYNEPELNIGTRAPQTIEVPRDANVEDTRTTEERRKAARTGAVPVLMLDQEVTRQLTADLQNQLDEINRLRELGGAFPFAPISLVSLESQLFIRQAQEWEWRTILEAINRTATASDSPGNGGAALAMPQLPLNETQQMVVAELQNYRQATSPQAFASLIETINEVRRRYPRAIAALSSPENRIDAAYSVVLLDLSDDEWTQVQRSTQQALSRILAQGLPPGLPDNLLKNAIRMQIAATVPSGTEAIALDLLFDVLHQRSNLVKDNERTKQQAEQAALAVEPVILRVRQGEVIVREGEEITASDFALLDYFRLSRRSVNWVGLIGFMALSGGAVGLFWFVERRFHPGLRRRDRILVLLLVLSTPLLIALRAPSTNLPLVGMLIGGFYGSALAVTGVGALALLLPVGLDLAWGSLLSSAAGGLVGGLMAGRLRSREEFALLGLTVGATEAVVYLLASAVLSGTAGPVWYLALKAAGLQAMIGSAWSVVALGLSPYLEHFFDLVTPIRLAELANPNRPLLKRLASEAPGTFQHTLFVASLAEAAARALRCNVELIRAGTLYHDIGKMHDPLGFIENQMGGPNKHDAINDPWISAALIKKHVTEGLVMARKYRLPCAIQAFIPEHQGTMLIAYFYHQAKQRAEADPTLVVDEGEFRYSGPIPQSRETGIVMLADSCEAALRSLKDATYEEALVMVNKILRARWQDQQLSESGLTRAEMSTIAEVFVQVWQQFNHQRIAYPKAVLSSQSAN